MTLGIDVGKYTHNATLLDDDGNKVFHNLSFRNNEKGLSFLKDKIEASNLSLSGILVGMEATGHYWMNIFCHLECLGFSSVELINPIVIHARRNEGIRGAKTDRLDALIIAKTLRESDRRICTVLSDQVVHLRALTRQRYDLSHAAVAEKLRIISLLDRVFPEYKGHFSDPFGSTSLEVLKQYPTAEALAKVDVRRLTGIIKRASRGRLGRTKADRLKKAAKYSFAIMSPSEGLAMEVRFTLDRLNLLLDQIKHLDKQLGEIMPDEQELLKSIPGIGDVWAPTILAEVLPFFQPELRSGGQKLVAAAGLDSRPKRTGIKQSDKGNRMSKRGSKYLRTAVLQAANVAALTKKDPMFGKIYQLQRAKDKAHFVALSHVAHKMLHVIFAVMRDKKPYRPILENAA